MFSELKAHKQSLYGKVQLRPAFPFGLLLLTLLLAFEWGQTDLAVVPAMFANGLLLAGFVPWWTLDPKAPLPSRWPQYTLAPRVHLVPHISRRLLTAAVVLGILGLAFDLPDMTVFSGSAVLVLGIYLSQYLPVWRDWRK